MQEGQLHVNIRSKCGKPDSVLRLTIPEKRWAGGSYFGIRPECSVRGATTIIISVAREERRCEGKGLARYPLRSQSLARSKMVRKYSVGDMPMND
ncbi:hypothetical protein E2C01_047264 [Portunus trituberculatus]|uniref:Uncharacterized protein n=1 Tax=Portunus trituberculatus TaxID=210409 RepID=A0A5B7G7H8_PORTR|nr:hypothetical protein [Portunus trituberculatus]